MTRAEAQCESIEAEDLEKRLGISQKLNFKAGGYKSLSDVLEDLSQAWETCSLTAEEKDTIAKKSAIEEQE